MELSFIDWDSLDEEEYAKLNHIINYPYGRSSVQLPFQQERDLLDPIKTQQDYHGSQAPVFQPGVPPPNMVGYPVQMHWPPGAHGLVDPGDGQYPYAVHGGYVFQNPSMSGGCEAPMGFMNGLPLYAYPGMGMGHPMPAHFQGVIPQADGNYMTMPMTVPGDEAVMSPMHHVQNLPHYPQHMTQPDQDPDSFGFQTGHHATLHQQVGMTIPEPQPDVYIPQTHIENKDKTAYTEPDLQSKQSPVVVKGLKTKLNASALEFGGPVVFKPDPSQTKNCENNNNKITPVDSSSSVIINIEDNNTTSIFDSNEPNIINNGVIKDSPPPKGEDINNIDRNITNSEKIVVNSNGPNDTEVDSVNQDSEPVVQPQQQGVKSWSSLFSSKIPSSQPTSGVNGTCQPLPSPHVDASSFPAIGSALSAEARNRDWRPHPAKLQKIKTVDVQDDPLAHRLLDQLNDLQIVHTPVVIQPRGLMNGSNTCFLNAPLQVLMGCPPFVHMFRSFKHLPSRRGSLSSTPILDSLVQFVNSFQNGQRLRNPGLRPKKLSPSDLNIGQSFIPEPVLSVAHDILGLNIGVQHDAEEFLSQILSICNEEMEKLLKMNKSDVSESTVENTVNGGDHMPRTNEVDNDEDEDEAWQQVGPKNHHVETNVNDCGQTPISSIFAGLSRSCLVKETGKTSDTVDSFFSLKLDIQADSVHSVKDALLRLNTTEIVHDADGRKVHGQRRMFFDVLPHVLIMHLKLFRYSHGDGQKIQKKISFDVDLQVPKEIISKVGKPKYSSSKSRNYKLFGVVNHHGSKINDGHYTSDVFLPITSGWLRFDDVNIHVIQESDVLNYSDRNMPYILFYRRMDQT